MFSATFAKATQDLAASHLDEKHIRVKVGRAGSTHKNIYQHVSTPTFPPNSLVANSCKSLSMLQMIGSAIVSAIL